MKQVIRWLLMIVLLIAVTLPANAHPGGTDSAGGHTDRSTGEYHYHHGYSAHQHYDIDGDGKVDCPYDFKDNTDHKSGSNKSGNSNTTYSTSPTTSATEPPRPSTEPTTPKDTTEEGGIKPVPTWIYWCFGGLSLMILLMWVKIRSQKEEIEDMQSSHADGIKRLREQHEQQLRTKEATETDIANAKEELGKIKAEVTKAESGLRELMRKSELEKQKASRAIADRAMYRCAPIDVTFSADGKPVYWKHNKEKPYGDYTIYIKRDSSVYHTDRTCASYFAKEAHIFDYIAQRRPCMKCADGVFDFKKVPDWYAAWLKERLSD